MVHAKIESPFIIAVENFLTVKNGIGFNHFLIFPVH
jgi:hypothetical protein